MRIIALDIVRLYAALAVVLYHYISRPESHAYPLLAQFTQFGYLGMPLFFIISGYAISLSANNRTALQFGAARFVRLYPTVWLAVIFTTLCLYIFQSKTHSPFQILANFTLLNEYLQYRYIDGVYWTLTAQLKFYALTFILLSAGIFQKYRLWLSIWLGLTVLHTATGQPFFLRWIISPVYSSFFIAGIASFLIHKEGPNTFNILLFLLSLVISSVTGFHQVSGFIPHAGDLEKYASVAFIWFFYFVFYLIVTNRIRLPEKKILIYLGAITYPLFLVHNMAGKAIIDHVSRIMPEEITIFCVVLLMIGIAFMIHIFFEKPVARRLRNLFSYKVEQQGERRM